VAAQVGTTPDKSPYLDDYKTQELSLESGWFFGGHDPAHVAPHDGLLTGIRYGWRAGGPAVLTAEFAEINTHRTVKDPSKSEGQGRDVGDEAWPLYNLTVGLELALTGEKTWHRTIPVLRIGTGAMSDLKQKADLGGFEFGTRFAFDFGAGIRWVPAGRWGLRADVDSRAYSVGYPTAYYLPPTAANGGGNAILPISGSKSAWTWNPSLSLGLTYSFGR
jgi:hypothetical protein